MKLEDFETLELAKVAPLVVGKLMSPDMLLKFITVFNLVEKLVDSPTTNEASAVRASLNFGSEFNFITGHTSAVTEMLDKLISDKIVPAEFKTAVVNYANQPSYPLSKKTLHEFKIAKGTCEQVNVTAIDGHVTIIVSDDCEQHNPRLMATNPRTNKTARINNFMGVSEAGKYDCVVPAANRDWVLSVDNAYGVVS